MPCISSWIYADRQRNERTCLIEKKELETRHPQSGKTFLVKERFISHHLRPNLASISISPLLNVSRCFILSVAGSQQSGQDTHRTLSLRLVLTTMEIMDYLIMYDHGALNILYLAKGSAEAMPTWTRRERLVTRLSNCVTENLFFISLWFFCQLWSRVVGK